MIAADTGKCESCGCCLAKERLCSRGEVILGDKQVELEDRVWDGFTVHRAWGERNQFGAGAKGCGTVSTADHSTVSVGAGHLVWPGHLHIDSQICCPPSSFLHTGLLTPHEQHPSGSLLLCTARPVTLRSLEEAFPSPLDSNPNHSEELTL